MKCVLNFRCDGDNYRTFEMRHLESYEMLDYEGAYKFPKTYRSQQIRTWRRCESSRLYLRNLTCAKSVFNILVLSKRTE